MSFFAFLSPADFFLVTDYTFPSPSTDLTEEIYSYIITQGTADAWPLFSDKPALLLGQRPPVEALTSPSRLIAAY